MLTPERLARGLRRRTVGTQKTAIELLEQRISNEPELARLLSVFTDQAARDHWGTHPLDDPWLRLAVRYFQAWRVDRVRRLARDLDRAVALDVGASDGRILRALGKSGTGVNISADAVANIRRNGCEAVRADAQTLPFPDDHADLLLCFETLEHVDNPVAFLRELARVLKPNGQLFLSIPGVTRTTVHPRADAPRGSEHVFEFSDADFRNVVTHTLLEVVTDDVCDLVAGPRELRRRLFAASWARSDIVLDTFRRFRFYELRPSRPELAC